MQLVPMCVPMCVPWVCALIAQLQYIRCARTDKGVHAAANVISLNIMLQPGMDLEAARERMNLSLPPTIRVHAFIRTAQSFHAKNACTGRQYEYILPTFVFNKADLGCLRADVAVADDGS